MMRVEEFFVIFSCFASSKLYCAVCSLLDFMYCNLKLTKHAIHLCFHSDVCKVIFLQMQESCATLVEFCTLRVLHSCWKLNKSCL